MSKPVNSYKVALLLAALLSAPRLLPAAIIGTNVPALPLTAERIAALPARQQSAWKEYLKRSERQARADQAFFRSEMKRHGLSDSTPPPEKGAGSRLKLDQSPAWYGEAEALRIADIIVSFQTPAGGWSKNLDMTHHRRAPGEQFAGDSSSMHLGKDDNDLPRNVTWNYVGTFDNNATTTQLRFLAKVIAAVGPRQAAPYRAAFLRGMDYIFAAQMPNGGWPQVWPLQGGYHDSITYNDDAMTLVLELLREVAEGSNQFAFVPRKTRKQAAERLQRGINCILETQIRVNGRLTVWCQQHDLLTLQPTSARNYEMPSESAGESAGILQLLMRLPQPNPKTVAAVHAAAAWFERVKLRELVFFRSPDGERKLVPTPGAPPLWARYYEIGSDRPIFGDRDKTIHDDVADLSKERRNGYSWFGTRPGRALEQYARWRESHPEAAGAK